jgi:hypothetical protein
MSLYSKTPSTCSMDRTIRRRTIHRRNRSGVVLLLVVTLLVMFLLIGITGVIIAAAFHQSSRANSRQMINEVRVEDFPDRVIMQLIRGTDGRSAIWGHDFLADLYGNDGIPGTVQAASIDGPTGGQFLLVNVTFPLAQVKYVAPDHFVGRVFTFLDGTNAGRSTRVTRFGAFTPSELADNAVLAGEVVYQVAIDSNGSSFDFSPTANLVGNRILINGLPFNGTGAGYKTSLSIDENGTPRDGMHAFPDDTTTIATMNQTYPFDHDGDPMTPATQVHTYLLPNYRAYVPTAPTLAPDHGGMDEPYDSVSLQDMAYSWTPTVISPQTPIIPSFYRYQLIRYLRDVVFTNDATLDANSIDQNTMRPFIDTSFEELSVSQLNAFWNVMNKAILRPMPNTHPNFTGGNNSWSLFPSTAQPGLQCTVREYLTQLAADPGSSFVLDADTDGDQIPDAIWIDPGLPVQAARDGRRFKILAAIQVRDLNAAINVNTISSGQSIATQLQQINSQNLSVFLPIGRGRGFGPAEITAMNVQGGTTDIYLNEAQQLLLGFGNLVGRYGDVPGFAEPGAPLAVRAQTDATNLIPKIKSPAPYTSTDLLGWAQIGFDHDGAPVFVNEAMMAPEGSPYAFDPLRRNQKHDVPFTEAELEKIYRRFDIDGPINPGRLETLAPATSYGTVAGALRALTTVSVHVPQPGNLPAAELRRTGSAGVGTTFYASFFLPIYQTRLTALINADPGHMVTSLSDKVLAAQNYANLVMPFELRHGYPMNVNRPLGNGVDENGNGSIDEIYLNGATPALEDFNQRAFVDTNRPVDGAGNNSIRDNFPQYGQALSSFTNGEYSLGNGNVVDPRVLYARHLYCTAAFTLARSNGTPFTYQTSASNAQAVTLRRLAQWAINCAEFRDPDGIMTAFEYDTNPYDGWDVNGDPKTMIDASGMTVAGTEPTAGLVWGCEQPEMLLTESGAFHNRGVEDTNLDPSGRARSSGTPDEDLDQVRFPQGSLFFELYAPRPRPTSNPVNLVRFGQFPPELYNVNIATGAAALALDRLAPQQPGVAGTVRPVWRIFVTKNLRDQSMNRATQPNANITELMSMEPIYTPREFFGDDMNAERDAVTYQPDGYLPPGGITLTLDDGDYREIWFSNVDPTTLGISTADAQHIFYNRLSTSNALEPGKYLVVGPRTITRFGDASPQAIEFKSRSTFPSMMVQDDLEVFVTDTATMKSGGGLTPVATDFASGIGNVQPMETMVCASNLPTAWTMPANMNPSVVVVPGMTPIKGIGMNISLSLVESNPTYWASNHEPNGPNERFMDPMDTTTPQPIDQPFDEDPNSQLVLDGIMVDQEKSTGTWEDVRTAFLQRLANPLLPWNPMPGKTGHNTTLPLNPYLTVDWMPIDLTVFNGEDTPPMAWDTAMNGEWDPYDSQAAMGPDVKLETRQRGSSNASFQWTYETTFPTSASAIASSGQNFDFNLVHTLGFLNDSMGGATRRANMAPAIAAYNGSPAQPFPWLTWYNRPFSSPGELLLVPATSAGRLFHEYGDITKVAANNESTNGPYQPSMPTTIRAASSDYANGGGSLTFPNGNYFPFPHLLNFFQTSMGFDPSTGAFTTQHAPDFSRLLDMLGMPGPFMGAEQWYNPTNFSEAANAAMASGYRPPFNYLPNFREAGRLNLNTMGDYDSSAGLPTPAWDALTANLPHDTAAGTGSPTFQSFNSSRIGVGISLNSPAQTPELINNPFRPANAADLMPNFSLPIDGVAGNAQWQGVDLGQLGSSEVGLMRRDAAGMDPNRPLFHLPTAANVPANPATRLHAMNRLHNLTTNQANCYAVWISLGKFEVTYNPANTAIPDRYELGAELGFDDGTQVRHRSFYIIDRTRPVAYETGKNHNTANTILLRRFLE